MAGTNNSTTAFDEAMLRYNRAAAEAEGASKSGSDATIDALAEEHASALAALLKMPAPDLSAVVVKLDTIIGEKGFEVTPEIIERLGDDLRDLSIEAAPNWQAALADYRQKRAASDATPLGTEGEDALVDSYCNALDRLVEDVPAPDMDAFVTKLELVLERYHDDGYLNGVYEALLKDARRLARNVSPAAPSLILSLHARYEQAWDEYNRLDNAKAELGSGEDAGSCTNRFRISEAMDRNALETTALRVAVCHQVPASQAEALILAFHVHGLDPTDGTEFSEAEKQAFTTGFDTLLDYMFGEIDVPHGIRGYQLDNAERIVRSRRAGRTGRLEEIA